MANKFFEPIDATNPCGESLRINIEFDSPYYQLKNLRAQARAAERIRMQEQEPALLSINDWQPIAELAENLLCEQTKDLEIASWLLEALVRIKGLAGIVEGLDIISGLVSTFGVALFHDDSEEFDIQLNALQGLSGDTQPGTIIMPILSLPIIKNRDGNIAAWQYQKALELEKISDPELRKKQIAQGVNELSFIKILASNMGNDFGNDLKMQVKASLLALDNCEQVFAEAFKERAPQWQQIRQAIDTFLTAIQGLYSLEKLKENKSAEMPNDPPEVMIHKNRETALQMIREAADYFLIHEIHSPVGHLLKRALHWADLELPDLINEIFIDVNSKFDFSRMTGIEGFEKFNSIEQRYEE